MRIKIVSGAEIVSGKEIVALELGQGLRREGHDVSYVTGRAGDGDFRSRLTALGFQWECLPIGFISAMLRWDCLSKTARQLLRMPSLWRGYDRLVRRDRPEHIIHTSWHHLLLLWPFLSAEKDWLWLHEVLPDKPQYRRVFGWLAQRLRGFVPVSGAVARSLVQIGVPQEKIRVIHNGMNGLVPLPRAQPGPEHGGRIGIVGQVAEWKGHHDLLDLFPLVVQAHPKAELHIFGSAFAGYELVLKQQAEQLGITSHLIWHGFVADRSNIYENLDICVVPSRSPDPLPTSAIEAAFFELPVVASRCGGLPEIIQDSVTGFLVEPNNNQGMAARLNELIASAELRQRLGGAARKLAVAHFNRERFADDFIDLLSADKGGF